MIWIALGMIAMLAGIVVMVLGKVLIGVILLLAGGALMVLNYVTMMRGRGQEPNQGLYNGLRGEGRQQSETVDVPMHAAGEQSSEIWEKMEK